jgi:hypothetical protein
VVYPKRGGRLAFWGFVAAIILGAAVGSVGLKNSNDTAIAWGLTGAVIVTTLLVWKRQKETVVGEGWAWTAAILLLLMAFGEFSSTLQSAFSSGGSPAASHVATIDPKHELMKSVQLDFKWEKGGFDNIMFADFTIKNPTAHAFKDFEITCTHYGPSGTTIDSNTRTLYEVVGANATKRIRHFDMGFIHSQVKTSNCKITDLVPIGDRERMRSDEN